MIQGLVALSLCLLAFPMTMHAEASRDSVPSNYGNWMNLTEGYTEDKGTDHQKMQVQIEGNVIHLCWCELTPTADNRYRIWYRRSPDLGQTWEDAKLVFETQPYCNGHLNINSGGINKLMTVSGQNVHFAVIDENRDVEGDSYGWRKCIRYRQSTDGGATLGDTRVMNTTKGGWYAYFASQIASEGDMVVIAMTANGDESKKYVRYLTSKDNGQTFSSETQLIDPSAYRQGLYDLQISGGRWVSMTFGHDWYSGLIYGYLWLTTSDGSNMQSKQLAPVQSNGNPYAYPNIMNGGNGDSYNYHPQMAVDGNTIHVMYNATPAGSENMQDFYHTHYQRSEDFGATWSDPIVLPDADGGHGAIAAKGQNVYVYTTNKGRYGVYYSNDGGHSWDCQMQASFDNNRYNPYRSYELTIDPYYATGSHAYLTGSRYHYMETRDGFKTVSRHFKLGSESFKDQYRNNNYALQVHPDKNGLEHWFLQYNHPAVVVSPNGGYYIDYGSQDIVYRRAEAEPDPSTADMAYNLTDTLAPQHRVVIPMTESLNLKVAITVEFWIRPDNANGGFQIASSTNDPSQEGNIYTGGWYVNQSAIDDNRIIYEGGICTDDPDATTGTRVYKDLYSPGHNPLTVKKGEWCHVAFTYDKNGGADNACLYINGQLAASATVKGNITQGKNPISLGRKNGYYASEGLLDNFAIWSRALTADEIAAHARTVTLPQATDADCRLLLTFDGTLKDQSQYGNDGVALLDMVLSENAGITPSGISSVTTDLNPAADGVYSIDGRRIGASTENLSRGIYVVGGKKYIVR